MRCARSTASTVAWAACRAAPLLPRGSSHSGGAAAGAAVAGVGAISVRTFANMGDELQKAAQRTGFSVEALSELRHAAELSDASLEGLETSVRRMQSTIYDATQGVGASVTALTALGVSVDQLASRSPEQQFDVLTRALAGVEDATTRAALAQDVFGRSGTDLLPLLAGGTDALDAMKREARELGLVFSAESADSAAAFNDSLTSLKGALTGIQIAIGSALAPMLTQLATFLKDHLAEAQALVNEQMQQFADWWATNGPAVVASIGEIVSAAGTMAQSFLSGLDAIRPALEAVFGFIVDHKPVLIAAIVAIGVAIAASLGPVSLAVAAIAGLITLLGALRDHWREVGNFIIGAVESMANAILDALDPVIDKIGDFLEGVRKIPGVGSRLGLPEGQIFETGSVRVSIPRIAIPVPTSGGSTDVGALDAPRGAADALAAAGTSLAADAVALIAARVGAGLARATDIYSTAAEKAGQRLTASTDRLAAGLDATTRALGDMRLEITDVGGGPGAGGARFVWTPTPGWQGDPRFDPGRTFSSADPIDLGP